MDIGFYLIKILNVLTNEFDFLFFNRALLANLIN